MSFDDELRRRMQQAADAAGEGADPAAIAAEVATRAAKGGVRPPLRLLGALGVTGLLAGGALGFTAMSPDDPAPGPAVAIGTQQYSLFDCPDGAAIGTAYPGDRVYVVGRDDTGGWLEVRDPRHQSTHLWVPADAVDPDAVADVPVVPCNDPVTLQAAEAETTTAPVQTTTPPTTTVPKPKDTQKPVLGKATRSPAVILCDASSVIGVTANDNVGVTSVTGTYVGLGGSPLVFSKVSGSLWQATFGPFPTFSPGVVDVVVTITARDAAGNVSTSTSATVQVQECLI